ncbi:B/F/G family RNA polymerase sigma-70 factor [Nocardia nova]|uniref:RNA polymerase sigma factor SigF n=1 Tax=Nocardia nova TaxID=37330 RepID=UPI000CE9EC97|nr:B/F/G family RNA polymerase sigma-70 factor [Nocardia nova]
MTHEPIARRAETAARHGANSYDNIEPWFEKLAALDHADPHRESVRAKIIELCLPLAEHIARKFSGRGETFDDLHQVARLGLVLAVDRFDPVRGNSFLSFAVPTVMGEVRRHFRDYTWSTRVPRAVKELWLRIGPTTEHLAHELGRMPTARELSEALDVDGPQVVQAMIAGNAYQPNSIDAVVDTDDGAIMDKLGAEEQCYQLTEDAMAVRPLIDALPTRERRILIMRFFESKTQNQIAEKLQISQMHVSRILSRTLKSLRQQALCEPQPT